MPLSTTLTAWSQNHRLLTKWDRAETLLRCFAGLVLAVGVSSSSLRSPLMPEVPLSRWCIRVQLQCHPVAFYHTTPIKKNRESECWTSQMIADNWANEQDTPQAKLWFHTWAHSHSRWGRVVRKAHTDPVTSWRILHSENMSACSEVQNPAGICSNKSNKAGVKRKQSKGLTVIWLP